MAHTKRILPAALACCLTLLLGRTQAADTGHIELLKQEMVRTALGDSGTLADPATVSQSIADAAAITSLSVDSLVDPPSITVGLTGPATYNVLQPAPNRLVWQIYDAIVLPDLEQMVLDGGNTIGGVVIALVSVEPRLLTQVDIELLQPASYTVVAAANEIKLSCHAPDVGRDLENVLYRQSARLHQAQSSLAKLQGGAAARVKPQANAVKTRLAVANEYMEAAKVAQLTVELRQVSAGAKKTSIHTSNPELDRALGLNSRFVQWAEGWDSGHAQAFNILRTEIHTVQARTERVRAELKAGKSSPETLLARAIEADATVADRVRTVLGAAETHFRSHQDTLINLAQDVAALDIKSDEPELVMPGTATEVARLESELRAITAGNDPLQALELAMRAVKSEPLRYELDNIVETATLIQDNIAATAPSARAAELNSAVLDVPVAETWPRMHTLTASDGALAAAEAHGRIVLAQQPSITEAEDQEEPGVSAGETLVTGVPDTDAPVEGITEYDTEAAAEAQRPEVISQVGTPGQALTGPAVREIDMSALENAPPFHLYNPNLPANEDPLRQPVNIDFREMDLATLVSLLAQKAQINVIAGTEVSGTVTANLQNVPLGRAIEIILRMNNLGIVEEDGVYRITTYEEAVSSRRETKMIFLKNAAANEVKTTLDQIVQSTAGARLLAVSANETSNVLILSGPSEMVREFESVVLGLDVAEPVIPTLTEAIKLNYSDPDELVAIVQPLLSDVGRVSGDLRSRTLIVTDIPIKVEEIRTVIADLDLPVKQVSISAMIVDAVLTDDAQTGIDWFVDAVRDFNEAGELVGNVSQLTTQGDFGTGPITPGFVNPLNLGSQLMFGILSGDFNIQAAIGAEVRSNNAEILATPTIVTVENKPARISIAQEIPFQELTQTTTGPPIATTEFKEVGTVLEVVPRVTHDNHIIVDVDAKQSDTKGESITGIPPEDKREAQTTLRVRDGQTIFIGGLRRFDDELTVRKTPVLGDIPVLNFLFKNQQVIKESVELLIFLTTHVLPEAMPELTPYQKERFDELGGQPHHVDATRGMVRGYIHPEEQRDPFWKWRRAK